MLPTKKLTVGVIIVTLCTLVTSQRVKFRYVPEEFEEECRTEVGVTAEEIQSYEDRSVECVDYFETVPQARCYHVCIAKKLQCLTEDEEYVEWQITAHWPSLNPARAATIMRRCREMFRGPQATCQLGYYLHKCFLISAGGYPNGTRTPTIDNVNPDVAAECQQQVGANSAEICDAVSRTDLDGMEEAEPEARCYYTCVLERMGYLKRGWLNWQVVRKRFGYANIKSLVKAFLKCNKRLMPQNKCNQGYANYKCLMTEMGEYKS